MSQVTLYLMIGSPGAGKTTVATMIAELTGASHLWADHERHKLFANPTHSRQESAELYRKMNEAAEDLLSQGKSVVFDTNFNFLTDRLLLRNIANKHDAQTINIWLTTPNEVARGRAVGSHKQRNGYHMTMTDVQFDSITAKLELPTKNEKTIKIDGTKIDKQQLAELILL